MQGSAAHLSLHQRVKSRCRLFASVNHQATKVGNDVTIRVTMLDANGEPMPGGIRFNAAIPGLVQLVPVEFGFPVHPGGGRHVFTIQVIGQDGELVLPLDVKVMS